MDKYVNMFKDFLGRVKSLSTAKKIIFVFIALFLAMFAVSSCTSTRSVSFQVDKAEKIDIKLNDSIQTVLPL